MPLKFENLAEIGDHIKAYDFEPFADRTERFVVGRVIAKGFIPEYGIKGYTVEVKTDTLYPEDPRDIVFVPFELMMLEYDNRVTRC